MALSTENYGYLIDPMLAFTDEHGNTIKNGFLRIFLAGTSTPAVTYANFDGTPNEESIQLDNSGRTATSVIAAKSRLYKVCVYDSEHSQESPIVTKDNVAVGDGGSGEGSVTYIVFGESTEADIRALVDGGSIVILETEEKMVPLYSTASDGIVFRTNELIGDDNDAIEIIDFRVSGSTWTRETKTIDPTALVAEYGTTTATEIQAALEDGRSVYFDDEGTVAMLWKCETDKYTFRTTRTRLVSGVTYLDIVDYVVNGSAWTTVTQTIPGGTQGSAYLKHVSSPSDFDTTGLSGMQTVAGVNDVPADGVYQVSVMLSVTPKTASPTKSDLVFGFYGSDGTGMPNTTFHAVVDDSQTFAQQLSFSTTLNLKAGTNSLKLVCGGFSTQYLVFVDDLSVAQIVNGVYHNGDNFDEVHTLTEALDFNNDDGVLVDGATGGPRFMLWRTLANKVLGFIKSISTTITAFRTGDVIPVDGPSGTAKMSKDNLLKETAQNALAGNVAPAFDPTKPNDADGYAYYKDEIVVYNGATYKFKLNHSSGAWNASEVDRYDAGESLKFFLVTDNPEYLYAVTDKHGVFLFGIKSDGSVEWQKGVPEQIKFELDALKVIIDALDEEKVDKENGKSLVDSVFAGGVSVIANDEFLFALLDNSGSVLFCVRKDGSVDWQTGCPVILSEKFAYISEQIKQLDGAKYFTTESSDDYLAVILDNNLKFIEGLRKNGQREFNTPPIFNAGVEWSIENLEQLSSALKALGLTGGQGDWSDKMSLQIPMPKFAIVDFSGVERMPQTKTEDLQGYMSFWDLNGNFFKKKVIMNAQGQSSMTFPKKNIAVDLCNDDWVGDDTFKLRLGGMVEQDSFHLKAYYTDFFRGIGLVDYYLYKNILDTRPEAKNRSWKIAMLDTDNSTPWVGDGVGAEKTLNKRFDNGALCFPFGFPCAVYLNGTFYGLFCFQLKKHRDNYMMKKSTKKHIHLDGEIGSGFFNGGDFEWDITEIRNPKDLYYKTAHVIKGVSTYKYDGDYPFEIADEVTVQAWINAGQLPDGTPVTTSLQEKLENTAYVHSAITSLGQRMGAIYAMVGEHTTEEIKAEIEKYFDIENLIDYQIFSSITQNLDGFDRNWQWTTWDGKKWFANAYDLDCTYGAIFNGTCITNPRQDIIDGGYVPTKLVVDFYRTELDARYAELRNARVIGPEAIEKLVGDFVKMIGEGFYKLEYEKWPDSPCNGDIEVDENWELVLDNDGKPVISTDYSQFYDNTATYDIDDTCVYNDPIAKSSVGWYYTFKSKLNANQSTPATKLAHRDSLWRLYTWIRARFARTDNLYNFNNN